jgi:hypothetical protein
MKNVYFKESNMNAREALYRIEALLEAGAVPTSDGLMLNREVFNLILESISIGIQHGEKNEN